MTPITLCLNISECCRKQTADYGILYVGGACTENNSGGSLSKKYTTIVGLYKIELFRGTP